MRLEMDAPHRFIHHSAFLIRHSPIPLSRQLHYHYFQPVMKSLILVRHAKSSWDSPSLLDFDRPLN
ncbi:MAG: hypothetical protein MUF62_02580, partial [Chitinophagaceae bacterium]|nr:hypothetical protein [Chitinophagaceae bacterium]